MSRTPGLAPRFAAWRILHDVRLGVPFDLALRRAVRDLEPEDRRLAHELAAGAFRQRTALDAALRPAVPRGLARVRIDTLDVLRLGAFQLLHLDRVPPHAAVQTAVGVARRLGGRRVAGFVNAVLRRLAESVESPPPASGRPTDGPAERGSPEFLAATHSHPRWLVERWVGRFGPEPTARLLTWNNARPRLVIQAARWTEAELTRALRAADVAVEPAPWGSGLVVGATRPTELPGYAEGGFFVQDPSQRLVVRFFALPAGGVVYDACAAPGGKTLGLSRTAGVVLAADRRLHRARRLAESLKRAGSGRAFALVADARHPPLRAADAAVLDVPCLGTGAFARNPDARWRVTETALQRLVAQAADFLDAAAAMVSVGGLLLFATCSLEPEENEEQIGRFLDRDPRFHREPSRTVPAELITSDGDLMILPQRDAMDGAFAARLRKRSA